MWSQVWRWFRAPQIILTKLISASNLKLLFAKCNDLFWKWKNAREDMKQFVFVLVHLKTEGHIKDLSFPMTQDKL